jgi:hypothetical protein
LVTWAESVIADAVTAVAAVDRADDPEARGPELHVGDDLLRVGERQLVAHHAAHHRPAPHAAAGEREGAQRERDERYPSRAQAACATGWKLRGSPALATAP